VVPKKRFEVVDELVVQFMEVQAMGIVILQKELLEISLCLHSSASRCSILKPLSVISKVKTKKQAVI